MGDETGDGNGDSDWRQVFPRKKHRSRCLSGKSSQGTTTPCGLWRKVDWRVGVLLWLLSRSRFRRLAIEDLVLMLERCGRHDLIDNGQEGRSVGDDDGNKRSTATSNCKTTKNKQE
jgi:hypothetical protein